MKIKICAIGKCKDARLLSLIDNYRQRLKGTLEILELKPSTPREEAEVLWAASEKYHRILLDAKGKKMDSMQFADRLQRLGAQTSSRIAFLIGGDTGFDQSLVERIADRVSLSDMTLPHMLARLMLSEQIYRAFCIMQNHPYHK